MPTSAEIRQRFLDYFRSREHLILPSSGLAPKDDPTLLFTNAGMVQFKQVFLGREKPAGPRATTSQKCLRVGGKHNDLENVGRTARHHTFFEMLGNFSFGDYFKRDAIRFAWDFLTRDLGLDPARLYATVYTDDDEAHGLWQEIAGLPTERIFRLGEKDNFWSMGDTGPCGPCSEILVDQGEAMACGPECGIGSCDCDRFLEIWNLVFMQFNRDEEGVMTPLPRPSIDTGMGLERIAAVCQGVRSNFETDLFTELFTEAERITGTAYGAGAETDTALRVAADHCRAMAFMIADGILPANDGRGYVLRRLIRRAFRFGRLLGMHEPFLHRICTAVVRQMGDVYPELREAEAFMGQVVAQEEARFSRTLDKGLTLLSEAMDGLEAEGSRVVPGDLAFTLYDTYGFPLDIVTDVAEGRGMLVDEPGFARRMEAQKKQSKEAWSGSGETGFDRFDGLLQLGVTSEFSGYEHLADSSGITGLTDDRGQVRAELREGEEGFLTTERTPFYGESGGQAGDTGLASTATGAARVTATFRASPGLTVHQVQVSRGTLTLGQEAELTVHEGERTATARNHTCTHLLHAALRRVLGEHVKQAGSQVTPTRLRFDFTHIAPMTGAERDAVEEEVNRVILADMSVQTEVLPYAEATARGAIALFGEKYGDAVRVVSVPGESTELCGGTHLGHTSQAGSFALLSETGVAAGVRRIEAVTGRDALSLWKERRAMLEAVAGSLRVPEAHVEAKVAEMQEQIRRLTREKRVLEEKLLSGGSGDFASQAEDVGGVPVVCGVADVTDVAGLRTVMDDVRSRMNRGIACLALRDEAKASLILWVSKDLHDRFTAPGLIKEIAGEIGGSGGGRPDLAQAGGGRPEGIEAAFTALRTAVARG